jgi:RNA polymerase sigma factor (sigma-70 family)
MASDKNGVMLRGIERIFNQGSQIGLSERELLRQFATGDQAAFENLVTRHGPVVLGVCRRLLYDYRDVEDAFQATFLVLLRKAATLRDADALGPWLHGVAYRVAARIRSNSSRRKFEESQSARLEAVESACELERTELRTLIDEEIGRLPEKYRRPVVLCYLEGNTHDEAARRLHCSTGSVRGRLDRARLKLKDRLTRRGLAPGAGLAGLATGSGSASTTVPASLISGTVDTLTRAATATAVSATGTTAALELADGISRAIFVTKLKFAASFLAAGTIIATVGAAWLLASSGSFVQVGRGASASVAARRDGPADGRQDAGNDESSPTVAFHIVDQRNGKPLPGVVLTVIVDRNPRSRATTDESGRAAVALPAPLPRILSIVARKAGFATVTLWFPSPIRDVEIPASYTQAMYPVETIGGIVQDEQGKPVAGVRVAPTVWTNSAEMPYLREVFDSLAPSMTDAAGRWRCEGMPAGVKPNRVSIAFRHPDYEHVDLPVGDAVARIRQDKPTVLPSGLELTGTVVDPAQRPIRGAKVLLGTNQGGRDAPRAQTNADGQFRFTHVSAGEAILTVQTAGFAPELLKILVRPVLAHFQIQLRTGRTIHGRVVDAKSKPLSGATVTVDGWRGQRTLDWNIMTDHQGKFQWTDAPPESFWVGVSMAGYLPTSQQEVPPAAGELTIVMNRQLSVRGIVMDAETRHAVRSFTLVPGMERGGGSATYWNRSDARTLKKSQYEIEFNDTTRPEGRRLRVEAEGYMPAVSRVLRDDEDHPVVNFALRKAAGISGVVHLSDGSPLAKADVVLVVPSHPAFLTNGLPPAGNDHRVVKTGGDGRFAFPPQETPYTIVALHDRGFAEHTVNSAGEQAPAKLSVQPWGRIEGILKIGRRPGNGETLNLSYQNQGDTDQARPWWSGQVKTDDAGRFVFERVMPGAVTVSRQILLKQSPSGQTIGYSHTVGAHVAPGATAQLTIGGTGRPIVGKVAAPAGFAGSIDWTCSQNSLVPKVTASQKLRQLGWRSEALPSGTGYTVKLEADGSLRVEDVVAGTYDLRIVVREAPRNPYGLGLGESVIATASREVVVPAMPGGRSDEPLDLGVIPVKAAENPRKGSSSGKR